MMPPLPNSGKKTVILSGLAARECSKLELRRKGVESEVIQEVVEDIDDTENAYRAAISKARTLPVADYQIFRQKLGGYLQRRGFNYGVINNIVKRAWQERTGNC